MIHSLIWTMYENLKILPPPHKFCIIRHNPLIPTVFCRPPLNTGSWPWTWRRWLLSGRFSGSRRSKRSQRSEFKPLPHLFFWNSIFLPRFVNEFLFHMPRDIFRKTAWHILIYTILNTIESFSIFQMHLFTCTDKARKVGVWHSFLLQPPPDLTQTLPQNVPTKRPAPGTPLSVDSPQEPKRSRHSSGAPSEVCMSYVHELWIDFKPKIVAKHSLSFKVE